MKYDEKTIYIRKRKNKIIKTISWIILIILVYNIILVAISNINKPDTICLFGYKAYIIKSDSMEPSIKSGDVVIVEKIPEENIQVGDIITFKKNTEIITHRISRIEEEANIKRYVTKGDNNNLEDIEKVTYEDIKGKNVIIIPYLGKIINMLENKIIFLIILLIILMLCFNKIQKQEKIESRREKKKIEDEKKRGN